jgi:hypothetical protein
MGRASERKQIYTKFFSRKSRREETKNNLGPYKSGVSAWPGFISHRTEVTNGLLLRN